MKKTISIGKKMQRINSLLVKSAETDANILLIGGIGVGKSECAKIIHSNSIYSKENFVELSSRYVNSMKDELFLRSSIDSAKLGTLYVQDIHLLELAYQDIILESLMEKPQPFRFIASSQKPLEILVKQNKLREELYNRLCVIKIRLPDLKDRKEDIPYIAEELLNVFIEKYKKNKKFSPEILQLLSERIFPGNILGLECILEYAYLHSSSDLITVLDLPFWLDYFKPTDDISENLFSISVDIFLKYEENSELDSFEEYKKFVIPPLLNAALKITNGNKLKAAEYLGINRNTLSNMIKRYNIEY